ncbi:AAC(3) family N-acetyltransferase [Vibrio sinaloensis]|uniref:AAC(3) family N-acetyltransferase n=1 Tax=Photobacterium sp. (strain ATCC 43367) TaxID=379097 RepID=UPI000580595E|nr:AAC(3) family N-acetyltransferase [Vibrio sinaloensis]KHT52248.1 hypothetical protein RJ46_01345 [Vibrio sinaloensis]
MYAEKQKQLVRELESVAATKLFVHSDSFKTLQLIKISTKKRDILSQHIQLLQKLVDDDGLILPAFSYQFPRSRSYDLQATRSEVGHISEFFRTEVASWRTIDPMFSVCGTGSAPDCEQAEDVSSFDESSFFSTLVADNAHILFYGANIRSATILHHAEFLAKASYRYWKRFDGHLISEGDVSPLALSSHFRPMGKYLDYHWEKIEADLLNAGLLKQYGTNVSGINAKDLVDFWCHKMSKDHLYLLDDESREWVEPTLERLGRAFTKEDFE